MLCHSVSWLCDNVSGKACVMLESQREASPSKNKLGAPAFLCGRSKLQTRLIRGLSVNRGWEQIPKEAKCSTPQLLLGPLSPRTTRG